MKPRDTDMHRASLVVVTNGTERRTVSCDASYDSGSRQYVAIGGGVTTYGGDTLHVAVLTNLAEQLGVRDDLGSWLE